MSKLEDIDEVNLLNLVRKACTLSSGGRYVYWVGLVCIVGDCL